MYHPVPSHSSWACQLCSVPTVTLSPVQIWALGTAQPSAGSPASARGKIWAEQEGARARELFPQWFSPGLSLSPPAGGVPVVSVSPQGTICLGCKVTKALLGRGLAPLGRCHLCQAPEMGHRPLPGWFLPCFLFPVSRCCQGRRTWRNTSTLCRPATGLVGWEISHTWDGPTSQSPQGQGNQQSQQSPSPLTQPHGS